MMQLESGISLRKLAKTLNLPFETVRDRVNKGIPKSKYYQRFPVEKLPVIDELVKSGKSIREVSKTLGLSKSSLHRHLTRYRSTNP